MIGTMPDDLDAAAQPCCPECGTVMYEPPLCRSCERIVLELLDPDL